jgi:hypothetical protein
MLMDKAKAVAAIAAVVRLIVHGKKGNELRFGELSIGEGSPTPEA